MDSSWRRRSGRVNVVDVGEGGGEDRVWRFKASNLFDINQPKTTKMPKRSHGYKGRRLTSSLPLTFFSHRIHTPSSLFLSHHNIAGVNIPSSTEVCVILSSFKYMFYIYPSRWSVIVLLIVVALPKGSKINPRHSTRRSISVRAPASAPSKPRLERAETMRRRRKGGAAEGGM